MVSKKNHSGEKKAAPRPSSSGIHSQQSDTHSENFVDPALTDLLAELGNKNASKDVSLLSNNELIKVMSEVSNADKALAADYRQGEILSEIFGGSEINQPAILEVSGKDLPSRGRKERENVKSKDVPRESAGTMMPLVPGCSTAHKIDKDDIKEDDPNETCEEDENLTDSLLTYHTNMPKDYEQPIHTLIDKIDKELGSSNTSNTSWRSEFEVSVLSVFDKEFSSISTRGKEGQALYSMCKGILAGIQLYKAYKQLEDEKRWYKMQEHQRHLDTAIESLNTTIVNLTSAMNDQRAELIALRSELTKKTLELPPVPSSSVSVPPPSVSKQIIPKISLGQFFKDHGIPVSRTAIPILTSLDSVPILDPQQIIKLRSSILQYLAKNGLQALGVEEVKNIARDNHVSYCEKY